MYHVTFSQTQKGTVLASFSDVWPVEELYYNKERQPSRLSLPPILLHQLWTPPLPGLWPV